MPSLCGMPRTTYNTALLQLQPLWLHVVPRAVGLSNCTHIHQGLNCSQGPSISSTARSVTHTTATTHGTVATQHNFVSRGLLVTQDAHADHRLATSSASTSSLGRHNAINARTNPARHRYFVIQPSVACVDTRKNPHHSAPATSPPSIPELRPSSPHSLSPHIQSRARMYTHVCTPTTKRTHNCCAPLAPLPLV